MPFTNIGVRHEREANRTIFAKSFVLWGSVDSIKNIKVLAPRNGRHYPTFVDTMKNLKLLLGG